MTIARWLVAVVAVLVTAPAVQAEERKPAPADARAYLIYPKEGTVVSGGQVWVRMGLRNMGVAPAGVVRDGTGHHHLLVDVDELPPADEPIPNDRHHLHFGAGQTEARLEELAPGRHTLQMLLGDDRHFLHDPPVMSEKITIIVP